MTKLPPIYIISLPNSKRRENIHAEFKKMDVKFQFWDGISGKDLSDEELSEIDTDYTQKEWGHGLGKGEIGCALSHIRMYEHMIEKGIGSAIILEDDAKPLENFKEVLTALMKKIPKRSEIVYLYHGKAKSWPIKRTLANGYKLARYRHPSKRSKRTIIGAVGYWLSLDGAKKLVENAYPIRQPADYLTGYIQRSKINAYGIEPNILMESGLPSEIDSLEKRNYGGHTS
ncbi:glycosyltransferase family 25 protein [Halomonas sp. A11-A]|jgi:glycosyl transferase family 25|uniref:glycosyltransferase family 25 protein n=1 Tax=Halomonas sp. A11-A TaxID=2183985 RepID=UPI000D70B20D|nr:glycosyltransferase family 25 protein [Halomonas sp. A11-A]PWV71484.1 glycosyl transferase family 25 [Halomonas sp. A11-A]